MGKRALITGIAGQDGAYLARFLLDKGYEVHGSRRPGTSSSISRLEALGVAEDVSLHEIDLGDIDDIIRGLDRISPDEVYNLAARNLGGRSFDSPLDTANIDGLGPMRLLESLRKAGAKTRFYQASTSELYGSPETEPQDERTPFRPKSPYGAAKLFAHWTAVNYREAFGQFACSGILFNHESPLRGEEFVTRKVTLGFARIRHGQQEAVELGSLDARRDWGFAGDYVEAMWLMLQQDVPDDFVLASGETHSVRQFAELAAEAFGWRLVWRGTGIDEEGFDQASGRILVRINPAYFRSGEGPLLRGNPAKAERVLGWRRRVGLPALVRMMAEADDLRLSGAGEHRAAAKSITPDARSRGAQQ